ncbi:MAG: MMPL family transporter, partial [Candidatus Heimdallarchaeota archaeon]|nr:MMPL family transporter [Candidatus Heimdallarchaeota archaeon]
DKQNRSIWTKISKFSQKRAIPIIIIVGIVAVPVSLQVLDMDLSLDINLALPSQSEAVDSYQMLVESFPGGQLERHYIILETGEVNGLKNASFFSQSQELILNLTQRTLVGNESFTSISYASEMAIPWFMAVYWISNPEIDQNAMMYNQIWNEYTNEDNSTTILDIITPFDPYGSEEEIWVEETRVILKDFEEKTGYKVHLAGKPVQQIDALNSVFNLFPIMIVTILVIVYIFIAIMFKSVFIPLRLILTIGLTMSWIFGLAVLVFEYDFFDWVAPEIMGNVSALYWLIPVLSFTIVLGLGLDYDIFLLSRISEYRKNAFTDKASIQKGVYKTGGIITAAGVIMAIAFSGLMISSLVVMKQLGFILCFAVLVDTFVIRTILVPAIMSIADKWNWWPAKLPIPTKDENFMDDDI